MRKTTTPKVNRFHIAVELTIEALQHDLNASHRFLLEALEQKDESDLHEALDLVVLGLDETLRMQQRTYESFDDAWPDFGRLGSLFNVISRLCAGRDDVVGRYTRAISGHVQSFLHLLEISDETEWGPNAE